MFNQPYNNEVTALGYDVPQVMKGEAARCFNLGFQQSFGASGLRPQVSSKHIHKKNSASSITIFAW